MDVEVEYVQRLVKEITRIDKAKLEDITFFEYGKKLDLPKGLLKEYSDMGVTNTDFISNRFYLKGPEFITTIGSGHFPYYSYAGERERAIEVAKELSLKHNAWCYVEKGIYEK